MKKQRVLASNQKRGRKVIKASKSPEQMLDAFEAKLEEFGVEACDKVSASTGDPEMDEIFEREDMFRDDPDAFRKESQKQRAVEIYEEDYYDKYEDVGGCFGMNDDDIYSLGEIKEYWNHNNLGDPSLKYYASFNDWWRDTRDNFMVEACTIAGSDDTGC